MPESLKAYYHHTNQAARAMYRNDFDGAAVQYDSAFLHHKHPFFVHLQNAILVNGKRACYRSNDALLKTLMLEKQLDTAGVFRFIPENLLDSQNLQWMAGFQNKVLKQRSQPHPWAVALREMFEAEQKILNSDAFSESYYHQVDSLQNRNIARFKELYQQYGFPLEEQTGIVYDEASDWTSILPHILEFLLNRRSLAHRPYLLPILDKALSDGRLHPGVYASLMDYANLNRDRRLPSNPEWNYLNTTVCTIRGRVYRPFVFYSDSLMQEINTNRAAIGLDSFHVAQRQVVCQTFYGQREQGRRIIRMYPYVRIDALPEGFVRQAVKEAGMSMEAYEIGVERILWECGCEAKLY